MPGDRLEALEHRRLVIDRDDRVPERGERPGEPAGAGSRGPAPTEPAGIARVIGVRLGGTGHGAVDVDRAAVRGHDAGRGRALRHALASRRSTSPSPSRRRTSASSSAS